MKKLFSALMLVLCLLVACGQTASSLPGNYPMMLEFSSGAGAWRTTLILNADGSFEGQYSDSEMGEADVDYPNGTVYYCDFSGQFTAEAALDVHSYPLTLTSLTRAVSDGQDDIRDGIRYVVSEPFGLLTDEGESARSFVLYAPTAPVFGLDEELLSWWPGRLSETPAETLGCYALWNTESGQAFFSLPQ